jgi:hypothetical protein
MNDINVDPNMIIESLSNQVAAMSRDIAILQAINSQLRTQISEIQQSVLDNE